MLKLVDFFPTSHVASFSSFSYPSVSWVILTLLDILRFFPHILLNMLMSSSKLNVSSPNAKVFGVKTGNCNHPPSSSKVDYSTLFLFQATIPLNLAKISQPFQPFCINTASLNQPFVQTDSPPWGSTEVELPRATVFRQVIVNQF